MLCKQLAKDNANEDCQKIIQALPGDPSIPDMVAACSKVGTVEHKAAVQSAAQVAALATPMNMKNSGKCFGCGREGHIKAACLNRTSPGQICALVSTPYPPVTIPKGTHIAQLIPFSSCVSKAEQRLRCDGGFGSTGPPQVCWSQAVSSS
ncbi:endogenous retrovirus group K member 8 Gag polyprotein-like [Aquila chrysaetos chrysaetos]|uniref:endogenous retrovirus group K member 8 Gag polyprotein-like n=1 Tax=Aquila chrysaetos chrysaetos TaxID=223781 RepID=UPI001B7D38E6|nr:endogenous retrovirus group K member 8 Gag polyprotein-like [Aquila chrysaetos chrysaetos]